MFNKHFILVLINVGLSLSELTISPTGQIVINEGDAFKITCIASEDIEFFYPKTIPESVDTSPSLITNESANGELKFIFERSKAVFGDTGYYGCVEASKNKRKLNLRNVYVTPETYNEIDIKWTYVYVKSETRALVTKNNEVTIHGSINNDVVIPCRPTSPDYNVSLLHVNSKFLPLGEKLTYDSKIGFTLHDIKEEINRYYRCEVAKPHEYYTDVPIFISPPVSRVTLNIDSMQQLTLGEDFSMNCSIVRIENIEEDVFYWTTPRKSQPTTRFINELFFVGEYIYTSELTIKNVSDEDVGEYKCYFYGSSVPQIAKANLQLHAKQYLNVTMKSLKGLDGIKKELGRSLGQYIPINAYPYPTIKWLDPKGNEIHNDWKPWNHHFNGEYIVVRLSKNNLTLDDEGNHTLIISNPAKTVTHSFFVTIITKPKIINQPKSIPFNEVLQNFSVSADCEAEGKPVPRISWNYTNNLYNMEKNSPEDSVKITSTADGVNKIKSKIEVNVQKTGKLICKACNEAGCVSSVAKIINVPVSMKVGPGVPTTFRSISLTVGDPLTIECKSSKNMTFFSPEFNKKVVTSKENLKDTMVNNGPIVKFELRQTVYRDSGWYGCANLPMKYFTPAQSKFPFTPDIYIDSNVQWVYVFVASTDHLFIEDPFLYQDSKGKYYVNGEVGKDVLLPCRPSSPNYQVKLYSAGKVIDAEFDPIKGMMIKNLTANSPIDYACVIQLDNGLKKSMDFEIEKPDRPNDLEKPKIVTRSLNNTIIGGTIEIDCTVSVWSNNDYILTWVMPLKANYTSHVVKSSEKQVTSSIRRGSTQLTIKNATAEDFCEYECRYYTYSSVKTEKVTLLPHEVVITAEVITPSPTVENAGDSKNPDSAVDAYSLGTVNQEMNITKGDTMTIHCSALTDKFPDDLKWYKTTQLLATDGRVAIKETKAAQSHSSQLNIADVSKSDKGEYTCEGTMKNGLTIKNYYHVNVNASAVISVSVILQLSIILLSYFM